MTVRVRLAPSPTGNLHIGTARTALFNWLFARSQKGQFLIRIEDTDKERSKQEFTENILEGLSWLGLNWDEEPIIQSESIHAHKDAIQELLVKGLAYRCYATENELNQMREQQKLNGLPPRYDNRHRNLNQEEEELFKKEGRSSVIRFKIDDNEKIYWKDLIRGQMIWNGADLGGDMVIARRAPANQIGDPLYNLVVVVDDSIMRISHVIRGEDHIANTAKQILLYKALCKTEPIFAHTPLILNSEGRKLSKRDGVTSIKDFKEMGYTSDAMANYMTLLGWSPPEGLDEKFKIKEIFPKFRLERVNKSGAKFDWEKLNWLNAQVIHSWNSKKVLESLKPLWIEESWEIPNEDWCLSLVELIQPSLTLLNDGKEEARPFFELPPLMKDGISQIESKGAREALQKLLTEIDQSHWDKTPAAAQKLVNDFCKSQDIKKGLIMKSLRAALLGRMQGPDLLATWSLLARIGKDRERISRCF